MTLDKRPDWEKFPDRWAMCDGGFVYHPGGARYEELPEEVKKEFALREPRETEPNPALQKAFKLLDARGIVDVKW